MKLHRSFTYNTILSFEPEELIALVHRLPDDLKVLFEEARLDAVSKLGKKPRQPRKDT
jgi:hypothetical protein